MFYCIFADSRRGCNPRGAMVRGLQLGSWGRGAWNLVFNHITRDGEPAGARRGLRGRHRRAPREPAPQAGLRGINSSCAASEPRTGTRLLAHTHAAPPAAAVRARTPTEGDFWGVARADSSGARPWPAMSTAPPISGHGACHDSPCAARQAVRAAALGPARVQEAPVSCAAGEGNDPTGRLRAVVGFEPEGASPPPPMPSCWWEGADARRRAFEPLNYYSTKIFGSGCLDSETLGEPKVAHVDF